MHKPGADHGASPTLASLTVDGNNVLFIFFHPLLNIGTKTYHLPKKSVNILNVHFLGKENLIGHKNLLRNILQLNFFAIANSSITLINQLTDK